MSLLKKNVVCLKFIAVYRGNWFWRYK